MSINWLAKIQVLRSLDNMKISGDGFPYDKLGKNKELTAENPDIGKDINKETLEEYRRMMEHFQILGFGIQGSKTGHPYISVVSQIKLGDGDILINQKRNLRFSADTTLRDLLHELDHVYQLHAEALIAKVDYCSSSEIKFSGHSPKVTNYVLDALENADKSNPVVQYYNSTISKTEFALEIHKKIFNPHNPEKEKEAILKFVDQLKALGDEQKKQLSLLYMTRHDNNLKESCAYANEIDRAKNEKAYAYKAMEITEMKENVRESYERFDKPTSMNSPFKDKMTRAEMQKIPHYYCSFFKAEPKAVDLTVEKTLEETIKLNKS